MQIGKGDKIFKLFCGSDRHFCPKYICWNVNVKCIWTMFIEHLAQIIYKIAKCIWPNWKMYLLLLLFPEKKLIGKIANFSTFPKYDKIKAKGKWSNGVEKWNGPIFIHIYVKQCNVKSCKKFDEKAQTGKFTIFERGSQLKSWKTRETKIMEN